MKDLFNVILIIFVTLTIFVCMMFFAEEVLVQHEAIHLRNRVIEQIEINSGYTTEAEEEINKLINDSERTIVVNVSKKGKLSYGEKINIEVIIFYERKLPFDLNGKLVKYSIIGEYYNING